MKTELSYSDIHNEVRIQVTPDGAAEEALLLMLKRAGAKPDFKDDPFSRGILIKVQLLKDNAGQRNGTTLPRNQPEAKKARRASLGTKSTAGR